MRMMLLILALTFIGGCSTLNGNGGIPAKQINYGGYIVIYYPDGTVKVAHDSGNIKG